MKSTEGSCRRSRTVMSAVQNRTLMEHFETNQFPSTEAREELSRVLGMKPRTIQIWFQNQRQKAKARDARHPDRLGRLHLLASAALGKLRERDAAKDNIPIQRL